MDPYAVLGIEPGAPAAQVEAAYRAQLRAWHPDLHQNAGDQAVAAAEARTRELNEAMARIRAGWRPPAGGARGTDPFGPPAPGHDWFGGVDGPRAPVPCPFCGDPFDDLRAYEHHLAHRHGLVDVGAPRARRAGRLQRIVGTTRFVPAWLALLVVLACLPVLPLEWWLAPLSLLALVLWAQTRPVDRWR